MFFSSFKLYCSFIFFWISFYSIFSLIEASSARRIVVFSSTSRFTKVDSGDRAEIDVVALLSDAEERVVNWAIHYDIEWVILRPTLIYGSG